MFSFCCRKSASALTMLTLALMLFQSLPCCGDTIVTAAYEQILEKPEDFLGKKIRLQATLENAQDGLPAPFDQLLGRSYLLLKVKGFKPELPILFNKSKKSIVNDTFEIGPGKLVTIYVTVRTKIFRDREANENRKLFYLYAEGMTEGIAIPEKYQNAKADDFKEVDIRKLAIFRKEYLNKKVKFKSSYSGFRNSIPSWLSNVTKINSENHLELQGGYELLVVARDNEACTNVILDAQTASGDKSATQYNVCGILRRLELVRRNGHTDYLYYFYVHTLEVIKSPEK